MSYSLNKSQVTEIIRNHINNFNYYKKGKYKYYENNSENYSKNVKNIISCNQKECLISGPQLNNKRYEKIFIIKFLNNENEICCLNINKTTIPDIILNSLKLKDA